VSAPKLMKSGRSEGAPYLPTGNPMTDAVGPASYANRADVPDRTVHGDAKIVPMRILPGFSIAEGDPDPRGLQVRACDGVIAGTIVDVWVDRSEPQVRYYEVQVSGSDQLVLLPVAFVQWPYFGFRPSDHVRVKAITAAQFRDVPPTRSPLQITFLEEDRIMAYYAGGHLYATPARSQPIL
jgi:photosynthetic reaction center H subunit